MLIKLQKTRYSSEYFVIENARHVTYRVEPLVYFNESDLLLSMQEFISTIPNDKYRPLCWYQMEEGGSGHAGYELDFTGGYHINQISFVDEDGKREVIRFDGEAFLCNDDGKTIHRIKRGGCVSVFVPTPSEATDGGNSVTPSLQPRAA